MSNKLSFEKFQDRPKDYDVICYDGSLDNAHALIEWVEEKSTRSQKLYFESKGWSDRLVLHGFDGTFDLFTGDYLFRDLSGHFFIVSKSDAFLTYMKVAK